MKINLKQVFKEGGKLCPWKFSCFLLSNASSRYCFCWCPIISNLGNRRTCSCEFDLILCTKQKGFLFHSEIWINYLHPFSIIDIADLKQLNVKTNDGMRTLSLWMRHEKWWQYLLGYYSWEMIGRSMCTLHPFPMDKRLPQRHCFGSFSLFTSQS